jgi:TRAP-type C4-dicarboxylate transport system permease small subunit
MQIFDRWLRRIEQVAMLLVAAALFSMMMITVVDVVLRYVFNAPFSWSYDVIGNYLLVVLFFLALSYTLREQGHIALDLVVRKIATVRARAALALIGDVLALALFVGILYEGAVTTHSDWVSHYLLPGVIPLPTWLAHVFVPIGCAIIVLRVLYQALLHAASLAIGRAGAGVFADSDCPVHD